MEQIMDFDVLCKKKTMVLWKKNKKTMVLY